MNLNQLTNDIAEESSVNNPEYKQFGVILLMVIGAVISTIVEWFLQYHVLPKTAEAEFLEYYRKMNPVRRVILRQHVRHQLYKSGHHELFSAQLISHVLEKKLQQLKEEDVNEIFQEVRNNRKESL